MGFYYGVYCEVLYYMLYHGKILCFQGPWGKSEAWDSLDAMNAVFVLLGISYISALLGG